MTVETELVRRLRERLHAWRDISGYANDGWDLPPAATAFLEKLMRDAAAAIEQLQRERDEVARDNCLVASMNSQFIATIERQRKVLSALVAALNPGLLSGPALPAWANARRELQGGA